jgi:hypothetical protein
MKKMFVVYANSVKKVPEDTLEYSSWYYCASQLIRPHTS